MNRLKKLFVVCITIRTLFVFIVKNAPTNYIPYLGYLGLIPSLGFMYQYFFSSKKGALGGKLWWNDLRPIHSILYFLFATNAINSKSDSYEFLLLDVIIGTLMSPYLFG